MFVFFVKIFVSRINFSFANLFLMAGVQRWFVGQLGGGSSTDGGWGEWPWSGGSHQTRDSEAQQAARSHGGHGGNT